MIQAAMALFAGMLACTAPMPTVAPATPAGDTSGVPAETPPAEVTASPAAEAYDAHRALEILDTYPSLEYIRDNLNEVTYVLKADANAWRSGRQILEYLLLDRGYDPEASNQVKQQVFTEFDQYEMDAETKIYLINLATGLTAEAKGLYAWSLQEYSKQEIYNLFIEQDGLQVKVGGYINGVRPETMPNIEFHWYPMPDEVVSEAHYKQFNLARRLAAGAATREQAAQAVVVWVQQNFFHAYAPGYDWSVYLDGREPRSDGGPVAYPLSLERIYQERVSGCHEPTVLMEGLFHSLNIPALRLMMHGHGVLYLPTLDRYVHGDHVVAYHDAPPGMLLLTPEEILPFAQDQRYIYDIVYPTKYVTPLESMPMYREGDTLYFSMDNVIDHATGACLQVSESDWARIAGQLSAFNVRYDSQTCTLSSDRIPIQTLDELSSPVP